jgi:nitroreductase
MSAQHDPFPYEIAFSRNLGWVTEWEQQAMRGKRVAIAGMGAVGSNYVLTLARLGVGAFHIADLDRFEFANFNRQVGATLDSIDKPKVDVISTMARQINPELEITAFSEGVRPDNVDAFLAGADLFIDGLDFFVIDIRRLVFARCWELGIPAITAAPLGMGTAYLIFQPGAGMSFEQYFRFEGLPPERQYVQFLVGLAPKAMHLRYLVDRSRVDLAGHRGPSTAAAVQLCAGVASTQAVKLLLGRGQVRAAPYYHQFDAYRGKWTLGRLAFGNGHPVQRLKLAIANRKFAEMSRQSATAPAASPISDMERIIDAARWTPSGDNNQPWRFEILGEDQMIVTLGDHREFGVADLYDYRGSEPTILSGGMLLESLRVAASRQNRIAEWSYEGNTGRFHRISVRLPKVAGIATDPLYSFLFMRSVDRRPFRLLRLTDEQKRSLATAVGDTLSVSWHESLRERWRFARLSALATDIRLRIPEAFRVHQQIIDWQRKFSPVGIPAAAVGLDAVTLKIMKWAMHDDWSRMDRLNRWAGTTAAAIQLDYIPGLASAAFFSLRLSEQLPSAPLARTVALLHAGMAIQRFWLMATRLGLAMQPSLATLIFAYYGKTGEAFTTDGKARAKAQRLNEAVTEALGNLDTVVFLGRLGQRRTALPGARSVRLPTPELIRPATAPSVAAEIQTTTTRSS